MNLTPALAMFIWAALCATVAGGSIWGAIVARRWWVSLPLVALAVLALFYMAAFMAVLVVLPR